MNTTPFAGITPPEIQAIRLVKPTRLFVNAHLLSTVLPVANEIGIRSENIYLFGQNIAEREAKSFDKIMEDIRCRKIPIVSPRSATKDKLAYLTCTSQTTGGILKGQYEILNAPPPFDSVLVVMIGHGDLIASLQQWQLIQKIDAEVLTVSFVPP